MIYKKKGIWFSTEIIESEDISDQITSQEDTNMIKEGPFNARVIQALKSNGFWGYKTADKFKAGVPDIYVASGRWIESKIVRDQVKRSIDLERFISPQQHVFAKELIGAGDSLDLWYYFPVLNSILIKPYMVVGVMKPEEIKAQAFDMTGKFSQPANWRDLVCYWDRLYKP